MEQPAGLLFAPLPERLNAGYGGAWFNSKTPGQGFLMEVLPDRELVFLAWFTWDVTASMDNAVVGSAEHRWLTAQGPFEGTSATLDITLTTGGIFDDPAPVSNSEPGAYGTIELSFESCAAGTVNYDLPDLGLSGEVAIIRIADDNVALCGSLGGE